MDHGHYGELNKFTKGKVALYMLLMFVPKRVYVRLIMKIYLLEECYANKFPQDGEMLQRVPQTVGAERDLL